MLKTALEDESRGTAFASYPGSPVGAGFQSSAERALELDKPGRNQAYSLALDLEALTEEVIE